AALGALAEAPFCAPLFAPLTPQPSDAASRQRLRYAARRLKALHLLQPCATDLAAPVLVRAALAADPELQAAAGPAHRRWAQHWRSRAPGHPSDAAAMAPVLRAVAHGARGFEAARPFNKIFRTQFWDRALRGDRRFAAAGLGLGGLCLETLAGFFVRAFREPDPRLEALERARALGLAGFLLRGQARFEESLAASQAASAAFMALGETAAAARAETDAAEALLARGEADAACAAAERALAHLEAEPPLSGRRIPALSAVAAASAQRGDSADAERALRGAESLQRRLAEADLSPHPRLYGLAGRRLALMRLEDGDADRAQAAARSVLRVAEEDGAPWMLGLAELTMAQIAAAQAAQTPREAAPEARARFDRAVSLFSSAGRRDALAETHLERGRFLSAMAERRGGAADRAASGRALALARDIAAAAGMAPIAGAAARLLADEARSAEEASRLASAS
ncbi:MAG: hypothetical protein AAGM38_16430, partial [Pseudomonadota bacterium]